MVDSTSIMFVQISILTLICLQDSHEEYKNYVRITIPTISDPVCYISCPWNNVRLGKYLPKKELFQVGHTTIFTVLSFIRESGKSHISG